MLFRDLIVQLQSSRGTIRKQDILNEAINSKDSEINLDMFYFTLHPHYKYASSATILSEQHVDGTDTLESHWYNIRKVLRKIANRDIDILSNDNILNLFVEAGIRKLTNLDFNILKLIVNKDLRCSVSGKSINKAIGYEFIPMEAVQLALELDKVKGIPAKNWYVSPKLDGVRAFYDGVTNIFRSRQGKLFNGFTYIEDMLNDLNNKFNIGFLDGELYLKKDILNLIDPLDVFRTVTSIVASKKSPANLISTLPSTYEEQKDCITFFIFAGQPKQCNFKSTEDMMIWLAEIDKYLKDKYKDKSKIVILEQKKVFIQDKKDFDKYTSEYVSNGYEGAMYRDDLNYYTWNRSAALIKHKYRQDIILKIIGLEPGTGKYVGKVGSLICVGKAMYGDEEVDINNNVGSGITDLIRDTINKSWIGKQVEVTYQEVSKNKETNTYSLRFPSFKQLLE